MKIGKYAVINKTATVPDSCEIDDFVSIRTKAVLGERVVVKCRATISRECRVGNDCFIGAHAILCNGESGEDSNPSSVGDRVTVGAMVCILPGVHVCSDVIIGAGCVVPKDITEPGTYIGNPARRIDRLSDHPRWYTDIRSHWDSPYVGV